MILYHGTSPESGAALLAGEVPMALMYRHIPDDRRAFCTSLSQDEAARFAMRKVTRVGDSGVIVVFDACGLTPGRDYAEAKDSGLFNEQEIAVFSPAKLKALHLLRYVRGQWVKDVKPKRWRALATC